MEEQVIIAEFIERRQKLRQHIIKQQGGPLGWAKLPRPRCRPKRSVGQDIDINTPPILSKTGRYGCREASPTHI